MNSDKYNRHISLTCLTCGGTSFEYDDMLSADLRIYRCAGCNREMTKEELMTGNGEAISMTVDDMKKEIVSDLFKDFKKSLRGNKFIKFK